MGEDQDDLIQFDTLQISSVEEQNSKILIDDIGLSQIKAN